MIRTYSPRSVCVTDTTWSARRPKGEESTFPIRLTGVFGGERKPAEDFLSVAKVDAMLPEIGLSFCLIPSEHV